MESTDLHRVVASYERDVIAVAVLTLAVKLLK
jgi:hypothetical protein